MRRSALGLLLLLSGCAGFGDFFGDTHSFTWNPNRPINDSENARRVRGLSPSLPALSPEPGNVWPGPIPPEPTLQDLERDQNSFSNQTPAPAPNSVTPFAPDHRQPRPGSSTPVPNDQPGLAVPPVAGPAGPPARGTSSVGPSNRIYQTPHGPAVGTRTQGGIDTLTTPGSQNGSIIVPNGNGTSTIISPNGEITTVPTPK